ncbi:PE-PPE domain-containing protein [Mycobacterium sp. TY815]|uniref:PE family protein n=1 Tax=Mycobacterium sp. TY815 TaxID=3050581 RepID=UPI00274178EF|nr:PE-PPE domain-containing protein [Mycobacterium sp. TY815]MDP7705030.1 PE-PPE domain-containing protein [Mycobacterium sp. TY815]
MTSVLASPHVMTAAALDIAEIRAALNQAELAALGPTAGVAVAAADEVSAAIAEFFSTYASGYRALSQNAAAFHDAFAQALKAASDSYSRAEAAAAASLAALTQSAETLLAPLPGNATAATQALLAAPPPVPVDAALILSESGVPTPSAQYIQDVYSKYVAPHFPSATVPQGVSTPNGLYPFTGIKDLTLDISIARGSTILTDAIVQQLAALPPDSSIAVLGYSQSAVLSSVVMPRLLAEGVTNAQVNFVLLGNPMNPNGGVAARFAGLTLPSLGFTFYGATPDNAFPTVNYTLEYDGFADFPRYPINLLASLNAVMGIPFVHGDYQHLTQAQIDSAIQLPTEGPTQSTYYMIPTKHLPLLEPVRFIPYVGNPLAELLEPNLRVLVNLGYGDPAYGYDTGPANVPTPFGLYPPVNPLTVLDHLAVGTQQGIVNAANALQAQGPPPMPNFADIANTLHSNSSWLSNPPSLTAVSPVSVARDTILALQSANTSVSGGFVKAYSTAYATLLPTADLASEIAFTLPSYNASLFLDGMMQVIDGQPIEGLLNAIGKPIAADVGLVTLAAGFQAIVVVYALDTILFGTPHPLP